MKKLEEHISKSESCINCAFLCKLRYKNTSELSLEEREQLNYATSTVMNTVQGFSIIDTHYLSCYKSQLPSARAYGPWKHGELQISIQDLSKNKCEFNFSYNDCKGLTLDAVEKKQIRNMEIENAMTAKRALKISRTGLIIAMLALATSLVIGIVGLL